MSRCPKCGFEAPIWKWSRIESSGAIKIPEEAIQKYEKFVDERDKIAQRGNRIYCVRFVNVSNLHKNIAKMAFRILGGAGAIPYHATDFACPECGSRLKEI